MNKRVLVLQGPNLNLLGRREPDIYGSTTLQDIHSEMERVAKPYSIELTFFQSNHEGEIIDRIQAEMDNIDGIVINPGAFTHYSYAISDALKSVDIPIIEVHLSNIYKRESFRHHSVIAPAVSGQISGLGAYGYQAAIHFLNDCFSSTNGV